MTGAGLTKRSAYMEWSKIGSLARFNLATSGLTSVPLAEFPLRLEELEITAPGAYGYQPLQQRLALHTKAPEECVVARVALPWQITWPWPRSSRRAMKC